MIYIGNLQKENDTKYRVMFIHNAPFDDKYGLNKTKEELEQTGVFVNTLPEKEKIDGKDAILYVNPNTKELWYEYTDIPLSTEEKLEILENENNSLKSQLAQTNIDIADFMNYVIEVTGGNV